MKISAVIFDLNGTVLSDEDEYGKAFSKVLKRLGIKVDSEYPHTPGIGVKENWLVFIRKYKIKTEKSVEDLVNETQDEYFKLVSKVTIKRGFKNFIAKLRRLKIKTALATSNTWEMVEKIFGRFDIEDCFDSVTTAEEVSSQKPDPQIFITAAEKLGKEPGQCLVFEDSVVGVEAAHAAGMKVVGLARNKAHEAELKEAGLIVNDFTRLSADRIAGMRTSDNM